MKPTKTIHESQEDLFKAEVKADNRFKSWFGKTGESDGPGNI